jgi:hypothetical protein
LRIPSKRGSEVLAVHIVRVSAVHWKPGVLVVEVLYLLIQRRQLDCLVELDDGPREAEYPRARGPADVGAHDLPVITTKAGRHSALDTDSASIRGVSEWRRFYLGTSKPSEFGSEFRL